MIGVACGERSSCNVSIEDAELCGQSRPHRKVVTADSYISIDLADPYKKGEDQLGEGRYIDMLVGVYIIPVAKDGRPPNLKEEPDRCPANRCRNPGGEGYGSAMASLRSIKALRIGAGTLEERSTDLRISAIAAPQADGPADRCPNPGGEGYGSAIAGEPGIDGGPGSLP